MPYYARQETDNIWACGWVAPAVPEDILPAVLVCRYLTPTHVLFHEDVDWFGQAAQLIEQAKSNQKHVGHFRSWAYPEKLSEAEWSAIDRYLNGDVPNITKFHSDITSAGYGEWLQETRTWQYPLPHILGGLIYGRAWNPLPHASRNQAGE